MKRALQLVVVGVLALVAVVGVRTLTLTSRQITVPAVPPLAMDEAQAAGRLAGTIPFKTIFTAEGTEAAAFTALRGYLQSTWPRVHEKLQREEVGDSLLFTWKGSDPSLPPIVLMAHQDVVPVEPGTEGKWSHPPWEGKIADGFVWGRGAIDDKGSLCAQLEAVQLLLDEGFVPRRTVYLAMGNDEEVRGAGATSLVDLLEKRNVKPLWVLDEGSAITDGIIKGLAPKAAVVSIAEKGFFTVELSVEGEGGHSSMPPPHTNAGILAAAITRLEGNPFPASFEGPLGSFFDTLAPEMAFGPRLALGNRWLLGPLLARQLSAAPSTSAGLRTTTAVTMLKSGVKDNVLPRTAWAAVNFRIRPGETRQTVLARVKEVIADERVGVKAAEGISSSDPSPVSPVDAEGYRAIERTIRGVFPGTVVAGNTTNGATDARFFTRISSQVYRFVPAPFRSEDLPRLHGVDERVAVADYANMIRFYRQLLIEAQPK
jgi:carboxypeptidase PM20D1